MKLLSSSTPSSASALFVLAAMAASSSSPSSTVSANDAQRIILFAGPTGAASSTIETFYRRYASPSGGDKHGSFAAWEWPDLENLPLVSQTDVAPDSALSLLVTAEDKEDLQEEIMAHIEGLWRRDDRPNILLGTDELDRIGLNPYTGYNALNAAKRIAQRLELSHESIEVVMNYRTPRLDQWISVWKHLTKDSQERYRPFLCTVHELNAAKVWEMLDTAMNPLKVAQKYRESGFRVTLVDMAKVDENDRDVVHVLGCDVLGLSCGGEHPGWIDGLWNHTFFKGHEEREYPNFDQNTKDKMEETFRKRDCHYRDSLLNDASLKVANADKNTLWEGCHDELIAEYQRLADTTNLYNELRKERICEEPELTIDLIMGPTSVEQDGESEASNMTIPNPDDAVTVEDKAEIIEDLEEKKEAIKKETEQIDEEEEMINEEIVQQEDGLGGNGGGDEDDIDEEDAEDVQGEIDAVEAEIEANPEGEAAQAAHSNQDDEEGEYKAPDASSGGAAFGVLVPVVVIGGLIAFFVRRRRSSARHPVPVEFAQVDEEFGDATMEDMQPRYVD